MPSQNPVPPATPPNPVANRSNTESSAENNSGPRVNVPIGKSDTYQFLRSLKNFSKVPSAALKALADSCRFVSFTSGQYVTIEGEEESSSGFIVVSGCIAMLKTSTSGKELIVDLLPDGDAFGLLLKLAEGRLPEQLSARAMRKSVLLRVPIADFKETLNAQPHLFDEIVEHLLVSLQSAYCLSRGLAHDRVEIRIAAVLLALAVKFATLAPSDAPPIINFTRQQLADLTGTTPETAIRVTRAMQRDGLIDIQRPGIIRVLDRKGLSLIAES